MGLLLWRLQKKQPYDLALLDLMMPGMDGATLYDEIKKIRAGTVALIITAYPGHPRADAALREGAWKVIPKPVDFPRLIQTIQETSDQPLLLVVDDDTEFCSTLWDILREQGFRTCLAHDVATANRLLKDKKGYNLVLLDMKLPDGDGSQLVRTMHDKDPAVPIVLITGYRTEIEQQLSQLLSQGAKAVLPKPLDWPVFLAMVRGVDRCRTCLVNFFTSQNVKNKGKQERAQADGASRQSERGDLETKEGRVGQCYAFY